MKIHYQVKGLFMALSVVLPLFSQAQQKGLVETSRSPYARLYSTDIDQVVWTGGFWADRFKVCREATLPVMWQVFRDDSLSHAIENFEIAAGLREGIHQGPPFFDGDVYKWLEGAASVYAITRDPGLKKQMDEFIQLIVKAQRKDGYIHTQVLIRDRNHPEQHSEFEERLHFETYNFGHLMTAACVHYRVTGERTLLDAAIKAADYLYAFYKRSPEELAKNAICPSHYMGVTELYRTTGDPKYLELAKGLIDIRSLVRDGTDDNQDRIPFRQQFKAMGHAVRANYLYAGVADLYLETGEDSLLTCLESIWKDVVNTKMYVTGGCGALYDGVSPDGTCYTPDSIQKVHQAYGRSYQLPQITAHNETCANIGLFLWNRRMLQMKGEARFADIMEVALYNSILSGISLDGIRFFYTNPLAASDDFPYTLRWSAGKYKERQSWISCFCCPPNVFRMIAEAQQQAYLLSSEGVWVNLYGSNRLTAHLKNGNSVQLQQTTDYPWDGLIRLEWLQASKDTLSLFLRIPSWCSHPQVRVNGKTLLINQKTGYFLELRQAWKTGDRIELNLPMEVRLMEANPLVEESRNQVAVMRGPLVYCLESVDLPASVQLKDILLPAHAIFKPVKDDWEGSPVVCLETQAMAKTPRNWSATLYQSVTREMVPVKIRLVPYFAWNNRGHSEMSVWLPVSWGK